MVRIPDEERNALKQASESASKMIPKLESQKAHLDERIKALRAVVEAYELTSGKKRNLAPPPPESTPDPQQKKRARKGEVVGKIEIVLERDELDPAQIRDKLQTVFGEHVNRGTLYAALYREENKKFVRSGTKWKVNPLLTTAS